MDIKLKTHLAMLATFMLCNTASKMLVTNTLIALGEEGSTPQTSVVSGALQSEDDEVDTLPSHKAIRDIAHLRGKRFEWLGNAENGIAEEEHLARRGDHGLLSPYA